MHTFVKDRYNRNSSCVLNRRNNYNINILLKLLLLLYIFFIITIILIHQTFNYDDQLEQCISIRAILSKGRWYKMYETCCRIVKWSTSNCWLNTIIILMHYSKINATTNFQQKKKYNWLFKVYSQFKLRK